MKKLGILLSILCVVNVSGPVFAQQPPAKPATTFQPNWGDALSRFFLKHIRDKKFIQEDANKLALKFQRQLGNMGTSVSRIEMRANERFGQTDWQQRGALIMELWRIRSSIDFLSLLSPPVFKQVTGFDLPNLQAWSTGLKEAESKLLGSFSFKN